MLDPELIDPEVRTRVEAEIAARPTGRVAIVLREIMQHGFVTTARLQELGYPEARRAPMDVKDLGIPIINGRVKRGDGRYIASYSFGRAADLIAGRGLGRGAVPKPFRKKLLDYYGSTDCITGAKLDPRVLTVDHRVPYQVGGDKGLAERDASAFMLLDRQSQRLKSWSCEHCPNFLIKRSPEVCLTCFWASPEDYSHIATEDIRRTEVVWQGADVSVHDRLQERAKSEGVTVVELLKRLARKA